MLRGYKEKRSGKSEKGREERLLQQCKRPTAYSINCQSNKKCLSHLPTYVLRKAYRDKDAYTFPSSGAGRLADRGALK